MSVIGSAEYRVDKKLVLFLLFYFGVCGQGNCIHLQYRTVLRIRDGAVSWHCHSLWFADEDIAFFFGGGGGGGMYIDVCSPKIRGMANMLCCKTKCIIWNTIIRNFMTGFRIIGNNVWFDVVNCACANWAHKQLVTTVHTLWNVLSYMTKSANKWRSSNDLRRQFRVSLTQFTFRRWRHSRMHSSICGAAIVVQIREDLYITRYISV